MSDFRIKTENPLCPFCGSEEVRYLADPMVPSSHAVCAVCRARGPEVRLPYAPLTEAEMKEAMREAFMRFSARDAKAVEQCLRAMKETTELMKLI